MNRHTNLIEHIQRGGGGVMQPSRYVYFPKIEQKLGKVTANGSAFSRFFGYFSGKSIINYVGINF